MVGAIRELVSMFLVDEHKIRVAMLLQGTVVRKPLVVESQAGYGCADNYDRVSPK